MADVIVYGIEESKQVVSFISLATKKAFKSFEDGKFDASDMLSFFEEEFRNAGLEAYKDSNQIVFEMKDLTGLEGIDFAVFTLRKIVESLPGDIALKVSPFLEFAVEVLESAKKNFVVKVDQAA